MSDEKTPVYELLKYPIITLSVVLGLVLAKWLLGFNLEMISEIGAGGIKFRETQKATVEALANLELRINELEKRLAAGQPQPSGEIRKSESVTRELATEHSEEVSDYVARLAQQTMQKGLTLVKGQVGYIWIGNFDAEKGKWDKPKLIQLDTGRPVAAPPEALVPGSRYQSGGNLVLRDGLPKNDELYYRARKILGVIPPGTTVELLETPVGIDREFAVQYWARVRVTQ